MTPEQMTMLRNQIRTVLAAGSREKDYEFDSSDADVEPHELLVSFEGNDFVLSIELL